MEKIDTTTNERYIKAQKRVKAIKGFYTHLFVYLLVNLSVSAINMILNHTITDKASFFRALSHISTYASWIFWGIGLLIHGIRVFWMDTDWEDRKIQELLDKETTEENYYK